MTDLVRLCYTSRIACTEAEHSRILEQCSRNNPEMDVTGVLLRSGSLYCQVLEGPRVKVTRLFERIRSDARHQRVELRFLRNASERMFDGWAMAQPTLDGRKFRTSLDLLSSIDEAEQDIGLAYLQYWARQVAQPAGADAPRADPERVIDPVEVFVESNERSLDLSAAVFCVAILLTVLLDVGFYIVEAFNGVPNSIPMIHAHAVAAAGLCVSIWQARVHSTDRGIVIFQMTAVAAVAMYVFHAGYGIDAPALPYLTIAIMTGVIGKRSRPHVLLLLASSLVIGGAALLSLSDLGDGRFRQPVPDHHMVLANVLLPLTGFLLLLGQRSASSAALRMAGSMLGEQSAMVKRLTTALAARNYFFSAISHEIRTPMAGAVASVSVLKHPKASDEMKQRTLQSLDGSLSSLNRLLNDLLDLGKLESGRFQLEEEVFDICDATRDVIGFFMPAVQRGANQIAVQLPHDQALVVSGDRVRYQQMLSNLIGNAVKFTENGHIQVELRRAEDIEADGTAMWHCTVSDSGVGIRPEDLPHLFQPFTQASNHGYSKTGGTGLGLSIVAGLARQMGGEAGVTSEPGNGSAFWFTFRMPVVDSSNDTSTISTSYRAA